MRRSICNPTLIGIALCLTLIAPRMVRAQHGGHGGGHMGGGHMGGGGHIGGGGGHIGGGHVGGGPIGGGFSHMGGNSHFGGGGISHFSGNQIGGGNHIGSGSIRLGNGGIVHQPSMGALGGVGRPSTSIPTIQQHLPNITRQHGLGSTLTNPSVRPSTPVFGGSQRPLGNIGTAVGGNGIGGNGIGGARHPLNGVGNVINLPHTTYPSQPISSAKPAITQQQLHRPSLNVGGMVAKPPASHPIISGTHPKVGHPVAPANNINAHRPTIATRPSNVINNHIGHTNIISGGNQLANRYASRPHWDNDRGISHPNWGLSGTHWNHNWHHNSIHHHHSWYHGCWNGYWGSSWYAPIAWGGFGWGLGSITNGWGYRTTYVNPYYVVGQPIVFNYSRPVVVNVVAANPGNAQPFANVAPQQQFSSFDDGLQRFKAGDYAGSLPLFDAALSKTPNDPVVHEVRCLALFANGEYTLAAAGLNSLLASAPGMDWNSMSSLYGNPQDYTGHLRRLERYCEANPREAAAYFVLAYHYLVIGSRPGAINALQVVVDNEPNDVTARRMLDGLVPPAAVPPRIPPAGPPAPNTIPRIDAPAETDLVGSWVAQRQDTTILLSIDEDSRFRWRAESTGQPTVELTGTLNFMGDGIELKTTDQGTIAGAVVSEGANRWSFVISGSPANDPGLRFTRQP